MVERDPEWAGWCSVLVNVNDLAAMGATTVGFLDALGAHDRSFASRVLAGLCRASQAYEVPVRPWRWRPSWSPHRAHRRYRG
jgi:selenophosphate synthetase-related protein